MGFFDFFRPTWKHSDPNIRAAAIRELNADQISTLVQVAKQDQEMWIRNIAIQKIEDVARLQQLLTEEKNEEIREFVQKRLGELLLPTILVAPHVDSVLNDLQLLKGTSLLVPVVLEAQDIGVKQTALSLLSKPADLAEIVKKSTNGELRKTALSKISKISVLRELLLGGLEKSLVALTIEALEERSLLEELSRKGSSQVKQLAKQKLASLGENQTVSLLSVEKRREKAQKICKLLEAALTFTDLDQADEQVDSAQKAWALLQLHGDQKEEQTLIQRFERGLRQFQTRKKTALQRLEQESRLEKQHDQRLVLCEELESLLGQQDQEKEKQIIKAWEALGPLPASLTDIAQRFQKARKELQRKPTSHTAQNLLQSEPSSAIQINTEEKKEQGPIRQKDFTIAAKRASTHEQDYQEQIQSLEKIQKKLGNQIETLSRKQIEQRIKEWEEVFQTIEALPKNLQGSIQEKFRKVREALVIRLQEKREADEWKAWSQLNGLEQFLKQLETLQNEPDIKNVFKAWKEIGLAWKTTRNRIFGEKALALKEQIDKIYQVLQEKVQAYKVVLQAEQVENAKKKEALCEQAEALVESSAWKETGEQLKQLQLDWKAIGPVPIEQKQVLFERFQQACNRFFARRKEHQSKKQAENKVRYQQKEALCRQAEAAMDATDVKKTTSLLKNLQTEWKQIGVLPKSQEEDLWKRFRKACDHFFAKRAENFQEKKSQREETIKKRDLLLQEVNQLLQKETQPSAEQAPVIYQELKKIRNDWKELDLIPGPQGKKGEDDFLAACKKVFQMYESFFQAKEKSELSKEFARFSNNIQLKIDTAIPKKVEPLVSTSLSVEEV